MLKQDRQNKFYQKIASEIGLDKSDSTYFLSNDILPEDRYILISLIRQKIPKINTNVTISFKNHYKNKDRLLEMIKTNIDLVINSNTYIGGR